MTNYTADQLAENADAFLEIINTFQDQDRKTKLLKMYEDFAEELALAPASGKIQFHNAYPGGYIDHVMNVIKNVKLVKRLYEHIHGTIDFTDDEMIFAAMHHDLGKLGEPGNPYYIQNDSEWHKENLGMMYKFNPQLQYMEVTDRALFILQKYNVTCTWKETLAIKLADGLFEESNKKYLVTFDANFKLKTNLPYILHWADHMSAQQENDKIITK